MDNYRGSTRNLAQGPVCSCPEWAEGERVLHISRAPSRIGERPERPQSRAASRIGTLDRPPSRVSTLDRPPSRPCSRGPAAFDRPSYDHLGSFSNLPQFERPASRGASVTGGYENKLLNSAGNPEHGICSADYEINQRPQVHSVCCAEWESGLGQQCEWDVDVDIRQHIQQCTCSCNHMGYGNYMDYQTSCISELPDVAPAGPTSTLGRGFFRGQNGSIRCNGRTLGSASQDRIHPDNISCSSKHLPYDNKETPAGAFALRPWCIGVLISLACTSIALGIALPIFLRSTRPGTYEERLQLVRKILRDVPLIDGHNDLPWNIRKFVYNQILNFNFSSDLQRVEPWSRSNWSHTDLPRLRAGLVGAQFWSAYVPCEAQGLDAVQMTLDQLDVIRRLTELNSEHLVFVTTVSGIKEAHRMGKIASLIGVEGGHSMGNSLAVLRSLYNLGARYLTVTHTCDTAWADCCVSDPPTYAPGETHLPHRPGLSEFGKLVVREMNRLGMMIDLSHASLKTMRDALATSQAPVIFSHSSAHALCNSSRNVPDDILKLVALNGGLVMISFYSYFLTCSSSSTIQDVVAHINHVRAVAGIDNVGIGAGYDGINHTPEGLEDVSKYPELLAALLEDASWSEEDVQKVAGLNLLRVFAQVEEVKEKWRLAAVRPVEELIPGVYLEGRTDCMYLDS